MSVAWVAAFRNEAARSDTDRAWPDRVLAATPAVSRALVQTLASTHDPSLDDGRPPAPVLQLYFDDVAGLNGAQGHLEILATPDAPPSLRGAAATQQLMCVRAFAVPDPRQSRPMCRCLMVYDGAADNLDARVAHDTTHHTAVMAHFAHIREIELGTRVDRRGALSWPRVNHMLRNEVVVDDPRDLTAALNSPVRHEMRANHAPFGRLTGPVTHTAVVDRSRFARAAAARQRSG